jgi:hypothetical protein
VFNQLALLGQSAANASASMMDFNPPPHPKDRPTGGQSFCLGHLLASMPQASKAFHNTTDT